MFKAQTVFRSIVFVIPETRKWTAVGKVLNKEKKTSAPIVCKELEMLNKMKW
jgi:hypothetical protein